MSLAKLLIVEDEVLARSALASALEYAGFEVVGSTSSASSAIEISKKSMPEIALLDIDLGPGPTGIDVAIALRKIQPRLGIVFLTSYLDPRFSNAVNLALPRGSRYVAKQDLGGISKVAAVLLQAKFQPDATVPTGSKSSDLSDHQIAVLKLLAQGKSNSEIAKQLSITEKAAEHLITRIAKTLGLSRDSSQNLRVQLMRAFAKYAGKDLPQ